MQAQIRWWQHYNNTFFKCVPRVCLKFIFLMVANKTPHLLGGKKRKADQNKKIHAFFFFSGGMGV
jgi:hypothetical protein